MSIFGDLETPAAKTPEPAAKQLVDLSIKPHTQVQADGKGRVLIPVVQALLNPVKNTVGLRAEAKTAFSDGTAGEGVTVTFFVNGQRLCDVRTDDFGVAVLDCQAAAAHFTFNHQTDELTARIRGFAKEASVKVQAFRHRLAVYGPDNSSHAHYRWVREIQTGDHRHRRFEHLVVQVKVRKPEQFPMFLRDLDVIIALQALTAEGEWRTLGSGKPNVDSGLTEITLEKYYYNNLEQPPGPYNLVAYNRGVGIPKLRFFAVNWPPDLVQEIHVYSFDERFSN